MSNTSTGRRGPGGAESAFGTNHDEQAPNPKYARTRKKILDAAAHVLSVKGYAGTRLSDVAKYAEIQAPAIYYYFSSRGDLVEEVMACGLAEMRIHLQEALDALPEGTSSLDRILAAVEAHLRHELEISDYTTATIRNAGQIPMNLRSKQSQEEATYGEIWRRLFDDAVTDGQLRADLDPRIAHMLVLGALNWAAEWFDPNRTPLSRVVTQAQALVRSGLESSSGDSKQASVHGLNVVEGRPAVNETSSAD
ncbi:TetR/AcrR family transcriptional regulator [Mycobacterium sp. SMC-8]|uniref:TetR/AcrR family transcriptional regulator n=1 Tax=Mycobacterium sp. SMC-8 TaxID=2857060 RepID=UPI0037CC58C3